MNILMIGAHPDDCDLRCGGLAKKYAADGHHVRFLSLTDGSAGHQTMTPAEIKARRAKEAENAAKVLGIEYKIWDVPDGKLEATMENRERLIREIRTFLPDAVFCHRVNDYHPDHRSAGLLLRDAICMIIVPIICPDTPAPRKAPPVISYYDSFSNPDFRADVVVDIDDVVEDKFRTLNEHVSQVYEWLPYCGCRDHEVPEDPQERYVWLHGDPVTAETSDDTVLGNSLQGYSRRFALSAALYRKQLIDRYGEKGKHVRFAEAYEFSEYGASPSAEELQKLCGKLFPY